MKPGKLNGLNGLNKIIVCKAKGAERMTEQVCCYYPCCGYLAGPIDGVAPEAAIGWRRHAKNDLSKYGIKVFDPTEGKDLTSGAYDPGWIVRGDIARLKNSNFVLAAFAWENAAYIGTSMEIRIAYEGGTPIYVWGLACRNSYWLRYHVTKFFDSLNNALAYLVYVYGTAS